MTIDGTRNQRGRLEVAGPGEATCGDKHWLEYECQAKPHDDKVRCRYYDDKGTAYEWFRPGEPWQMIVVTREAV